MQTRYFTGDLKSPQTLTFSNGQNSIFRLQQCAYPPIQEPVLRTSTQHTEPPPLYTQATSSFFWNGMAGGDPEGAVLIPGYVDLGATSRWSEGGQGRADVDWGLWSGLGSVQGALATAQAPVQVLSESVRSRSQLRQSKNTPAVHYDQREDEYFEYPIAVAEDHDDTYTGYLPGQLRPAQFRPAEFLPVVYYDDDDGPSRFDFEFGHGESDEEYQREDEYFEYSIAMAEDQDDRYNGDLSNRLDEVSFNDNDQVASAWYDHDEEAGENQDDDNDSSDQYRSCQ